MKHSTYAAIAAALALSGAPAFAAPAFAVPVFVTQGDLLATSGEGPQDTANSLPPGFYDHVPAFTQAQRVGRYLQGRMDQGQRAFAQGRVPLAGG